MNSSEHFTETIPSPSLSKQSTDQAHKLNADLCAKGIESLNLQDLCLERSEQVSAKQVTTARPCLNLETNTVPVLEAPGKDKQTSQPNMRGMRVAFYRMAAKAKIRRNQIRVIKRDVEVCVQSKLPTTGFGSMQKTSYIVRKVHPRLRPLISAPIRPIVRTGVPGLPLVRLATIHEHPDEQDEEARENRERGARTGRVAPPPTPEEVSQLELRGGEGRKYSDDYVVPGWVWWVSGGRKSKQRLTVKYLKEWKKKSRGDWDEGKKRGFLKEVIFVLSNGKYCRNQNRKKQEQPPPQPPSSCDSEEGSF
ncbi:hypothetical protein FQN57_001286 [Myotisia sp. PD_48]|nr:hypothetical protein FQN57_001286 [Myotisia sp. PD_48]